MTEEEALKKYRQLDLKVSYETDKPNKVYPLHRHGKVYLYSLSGSVKIKLGKSDWQELKPGDELAIKDSELHEAVVGPDGWRYIHAQE